jgi:hypothetical protein
MTGTLHEALYKFIFLSVPFRMRNVSGRSCSESQNTHFMFIFLNRAVYDVMWQNRVEPSVTDSTVRRMRMAYCIT